MSQYFYQPGPQATMNTHTAFGPSNSHHNSNNHRSRRSTRYSSAQHPQRHYNKQQRAQTQKDTAEAAHAASYRSDFEAARSFDLEDDQIFCPFHLLTEDDVCSSITHEPANRALTSDQLQSIHSSSSDRSSSSGSGSPDNSPLQPQLQPSANFTMPPTSHHAFQQHANPQSHHLSIHQPQAQRARNNAIRIVDPSSRNTSPPTSVSPARQAGKSWYGGRRQQW